jgi:hypothetical protein
VAPADTAGSFAGVSTVAMARSEGSDDSVERGGSKVRRCRWLRRLRERSVTIVGVQKYVARVQLVSQRMGKKCLGLELSQAPEPGPQVPGKRGEHRRQRAGFAAHLEAHDGGKREGGEARRSDVGPARSPSTTASPGAVAT